MDDNRRDLVIRSVPGGHYWLNAEAFSDEHSLRRSVAEAVRPRAEKLVWIAADPRSQYGEVLKLISGMKSDTQSLYVAIATASQTGPVDTIEIEGTKGRLMSGAPIGVLPCIISRPDM